MKRDVLVAREPYISTSALETRRLGASFSEKLGKGSVVALYGTLGAGKTEFVKGICGGLGVPESDVNSPTFTLVNEYETGSFCIYHFDAYRLKSVHEFYEMGYQDYFFGDGICLVEWPDRVEELLPRDVLKIRFTHFKEDQRELLLLDG